MLKKQILSIFKVEKSYFCVNYKYKLPFIFKDCNSYV